MKSRPATAALLSLVVAVFACGPAEEPPPAEPPDTTADDIAAIEGRVDDFAAAYNGGDADALAAMYTADAIRMPPNAPANFGADAIRAAYEEAFALGSRELTITVDETEVTGGAAYSRGTYSLTITPEEGESLQVSGKYLNILERQADGSWKVTRAIFNSDDPPPGM